MNWPRNSRGSLEAEDTTTPSRRKSRFTKVSCRKLRVPVFRAWLTHWSRSGKAMETRVPESPGLGGKGSPGTGLEMSQALACGGNIALGSETFQPFRWANRTARVEWVPAPDRAAAAED